MTSYIIQLELPHTHLSALMDEHTAATGPGWGRGGQVTAYMAGKEKGRHEELVRSRQLKRSEEGGKKGPQFQWVNLPKGPQLWTPHKMPEQHLGV